MEKVETILEENMTLGRKKVSIHKLMTKTGQYIMAH